MWWVLNPQLWRTEAELDNVGLSGSGKSKLVDTLNGYTFTRAADRRYFRLSLSECTQLPSLPADFDFVLYAFDTTCVTSYSIEMWNTWKTPVGILTSKYSDDTSRICMVGTKFDLVGADSIEEAMLQCFPAVVPFYSGIPYINTSSITSLGVDSLALLIVDQIFPCPPEVSWHEKFKYMADRCLDAFASIFALPVPSNINQNTDNSYDIPDDDAVDPLYKSPEAQAHNDYLSTLIPEKALFHVSPAYKITPTLIAKPRNPLEFDGTTYARSHLNIPIPQPRYPHLKHWFVTDFIKGKTLAECWDVLGIWMRFRVVCTMRCYISQMRRLSRDFPGSPLGGYVYGHVFSSGFYSGPFKTAQSFQRFAEHVIYQGWVRLRRGHALAERPDIKHEYGGPYVFTHADISPSNLMLSDDGVLWVIDWASCGFYPKWIEATAAHRYTDVSGIKSWNWFLFLVFGKRPRQGRDWQHFAEGADIYSEWALPSTYPS